MGRCGLFRVGSAVMRFTNTRDARNSVVYGGCYLPFDDVKQFLCIRQWRNGETNGEQ